MFLIGDGGLWRVLSQPNKSVKGTRRPLAVLEFGFLSRFGGFAEFPVAARLLPLR